MVTRGVRVVFGGSSCKKNSGRLRHCPHDDEQGMQGFLIVESTGLHLGVLEAADWRRCPFPASWETSQNAPGPARASQGDRCCPGLDPDMSGPLQQGKLLDSCPVVAHRIVSGEQFPVPKLQRPRDMSAMLRCLRPI